MVNEEHEDLLVQITDSETDSTEQNDYYVERKILDFIQKNEKQNHKSTKKTFVFIFICFLIFISSSLLTITFPVYLVATRQFHTYTKLLTLSLLTVSTLLIICVWSLIIKIIKKKRKWNFNLCLPNVFKFSFTFSVGAILIFWVQDAGYVPCHLEDPLKGCEVVFSLLFYFVLCGKKMSMERIFCIITVIIGVFVTVDFGICDKYHCYGMDHTHESESKSHLLWIIIYLAVHGLWILHFTLMERGFTVPSELYDSIEEEQKNSPSLLSIISNIGNTSCDPSLSNVFLNNSANNSKLSLKIPTNSSTSSAAQSFPRTSTPKLGYNRTQYRHTHQVVLLQHVIMLMMVVSLFWTQTVSVYDKKGSEAKEVLHHIYESLSCHSGLVPSYQCSNLQVITIIFILSYIVLVYCCIKMLSITYSAVTVVSVMMLSLPMSGLWWSLYSIDSDSYDIIIFQPAITGEAVSAFLGFPIIGIGVLLLIKSHIKSFDLDL